MKLKLDEERTALLCVRFGEGVPKKFVAEDAEPRRTTSVRITVKKGDEVIGEVQGVTFCNPCDQFQRFNGRSRAMSRAFREDATRALLTKKDRQLIAKKILAK